MDKYKKYAKEKQEWLARLPGVLSGLTDKQRRRLYLRFWAGWSYQAIADSEGLQGKWSRKTIQESIGWAKKKIKKKLTPQMLIKGGRQRI